MDNYHGADTGCIFRMDAGSNQISITNIKDNVIEGEFQGRAILRRGGFSRAIYKDLYHDIVNGRFRIKLG